MGLYRVIELDWTLEIQCRALYFQFWHFTPLENGQGYTTPVPEGPMLLFHNSRLLANQITILPSGSIIVYSLLQTPIFLACDIKFS